MAGLTPGHFAFQTLEMLKVGPRNFSLSLATTRCEARFDIAVL